MNRFLRNFQELIFLQTFFRWRGIGKIMLQYITNPYYPLKAVPSYSKIFVISGNYEGISTKLLGIGFQFYGKE